MKRLISIMFIVACWLTPAHAIDRITALVTVTNTPANGNTITVNGSARTWVTTVSTPATEIAVTNSVNTAATNLFQQGLSAPYAGPLTLQMSATNAVQFIGTNGQSMAITLSAGWGTVTYSTQAVTAMFTIRVPGSGEAASVRTNNFSLLVTGINDYSTNTFSQTARALTNHVNTGQSQWVSNKLSTNFTFMGGLMTNSHARHLNMFYGTNGNRGIFFHTSALDPSTVMIADSSGYPSLYLLGSDYDDEIGASGAVPLTVPPSMENILTRGGASNLFGGLTWANSWTKINQFTSISNSTIWSSTGTNLTINGGTGNTNTLVSPYVMGNLGIGHTPFIVPASLDKGIVLTNGTLSSVNPTNGAYIVASAGALRYRTSAASEGVDANNYIHNAAAEVVGSGTDYTLTTSYATVDFSGTDPEFNTLPTAGTYSITAIVQFAAGASAGDVISAKLYDATAAADLANTEQIFSAGIESGSFTLTLRKIATFTAASRVQIRAKNATAARGTVTAVNTRIDYVRLY